MVLTDEERRTLIAEGYPIPQRFPLSKAEERSLKKIRRKIKNKISAQESRRKKKEYMEELEKKVSLMEIKIFELERDNKIYKEKLALAGAATATSAAQSPDESQTATSADLATASDDRQSLDQAQSSMATSIKQEPMIEPVINFSSTTTTVEHEPSIKFDKNDSSSGKRQDDSEAGSVLTLTINQARTTNNDTQRKISTASNQGQQQSTTTEDDYFIDDILLSQERQENQQLVNDDDVDLVANLVGVVCAGEPDGLVDSMQHQQVASIKAE